MPPKENGHREQVDDRKGSIGELMDERTILSYGSFRLEVKINQSLNHLYIIDY